MAIGSLLTTLGFAPSPLHRFDLIYNQLPPFEIPAHMYHIRVKNEANRRHYDWACMKYLLNYYYGITLTYE